MGSLYRKYHLSRHWGDGHVSTHGLPRGFSSCQGRRGGRHRRSPGAAIQEGFHPPAAPNAQEGLFLAGWCFSLVGVMGSHGGCSLHGMARGWVQPGGRCIDGPGAWAAPASAGLPRHASSPSRVTLADRKEWMMKTMVLGQE